MLSLFLIEIVSRKHSPMELSLTSYRHVVFVLDRNSVPEAFAHGAFTYSCPDSHITHCHFALSLITPVFISSPSLEPHLLFSFSFVHEAYRGSSISLRFSFLVPFLFIFLSTGLLPLVCIATITSLRRTLGRYNRACAVTKYLTKIKHEKCMSLS